MKYTIGIVYAISQEAGNACYSYLKRIVPDNTNIIAFEDPQTEALSQTKLIAVESERIQRIAEILYRGVTVLANKGAKIIIIAANSVHIAIQSLREMCKASFPQIELLSIIDAVITCCQKYRTVAIFGSNATIESGMYQEKLNINQITVIALDANEQAMIHQTISAGYTPLTMPVQRRQEIREICQHIKRKSCEVVVLACTELSSLLEVSDFAGLNIIDSNKVLAEYAVTSIKNKLLTMSTNSNEKNIDDAPLWDIFLSRLHLPAIAVAIELSLFDLIKQDINDIVQLEKMTLVNCAGLDALLTMLAALGFLEKINNKVKLTAISHCYLTTGMSTYWGDGLISRVQGNEIYLRLKKAMRTPNSSKLAINGKDITHMWEQADLDLESAKIFTANMHSTIYNSANKAVDSDALKGIKHLLDVGGGSGVFADAFVNRYSKSKASIFELPAVIPLINGYISSNNHEKIHLIPGNFFEDAFPIGCDGILFSNILHDWPVAKVRDLLNKAYAALPKGGKIFIHEMLLNKAKNGPTAAAGFNLLMYINHGSQQFTEEELHHLLVEQGFTPLKTMATHPYYSVITAEK